MNRVDLIVRCDDCRTHFRTTAEIMLQDVDGIVASSLKQSSHKVLTVCLADDRAVCHSFGREVEPDAGKAAAELRDFLLAVKANSEAAN